MNQFFDRIKTVLISRFSALFVLLFTFTTANSQYNAGNCPNNIDFEFGNFSNWQTYTGNASALNSMTLVPPDPLKHVIFNRAQHSSLLDPYGGFPVMSPTGSNYSVRLGNSGAGAEAERLRYLINVPAGNNRYSVVVYYAVVLEDIAHAPSEQPKFFVKATEASNGNVINCTDLAFIANAGLPGFMLSSVGSNIRYRSWTPLTIDLSGLAGQQVYLEFTTTDCTQVAHFGYAYLDLSSNCLSPVLGSAYCIGSNTATLTAPLGYQAYNWWNSSFTTSYGTGLSVTIPALTPGTILNVDVTPYTGFGCRDTLQIVVGNEMAPPKPVLARFLNYCEGQTVPPIPVNVLPGYYPKWYVTPTGGFALPGQPTINTNSANTYNYYVSQISFDGCEGPRDTITINVDEVPMTNFSINDTVQCVFNNSFQFTNLNIPNYPTTQYTWDFGNGIGTSNLYNPTYQYPSAGNFNVQLIAKKNACADTAVIPVQVVNSPVASFTVNNACQGGAFNFTNTSVASGSANYTWTFGNGQNSNLLNPSTTYNNPGLVPVKLLVTMGNCQHDTTIQIPVHEIPKANFNYLGKCTRDSIQFNDISSIGFGTVTNWAWDFGGGITSNLQNPKMAFQTFGVNQVKLTASTAYCAKDTTIDVSVWERPIARISRTDTACFNQNFSVTDNSYFLSGNTSTSIAAWWWQAPNAAISTNSTALMQSNLSGNNQIKLVAVSNQGCASDTGYFDIDVKASPIPKFSFLTSLCENRDIKADDITINSASRNWYINSALVSNNKLLEINNLLPGSKTLRLTIIDSFGCQSIPKDSVFTVRNRPKFTFAHLDSCVERPIPFLATDLNGNNITQWNWTYEGQAIQGNNTQQILFSKYGNASISLYGVDAFGCVSDTVTRNFNIKYNPVFAGNDTIAAANEAVQLTASSNVAASYLWSPSFGLSNSGIFNPIATNFTDAVYTVTATSVFGCKSSDNVAIRIYKGPDIYVPTAFTPNNDGINDVLKITAVGIKAIEKFVIYNRFGQKVFETTDSKKGWDGILRGGFVDAGSYVFYISAIKSDGTKLLKKGTISLIR